MTEIIFHGGLIGATAAGLGDVYLQAKEKGEIHNPRGQDFVISRGDGRPEQLQPIEGDRAWIANGNLVLDSNPARARVSMRPVSGR